MGKQVPKYYESLVEDMDEISNSRPSSDTDANCERRGTEELEATSRQYRADAFQLILPSDDWHDQSTYILQGPRLEGISHNVTITVVHSVDTSDLQSFAAECVSSLLVELDESTLLVDDLMTLHCGHPAHRAIVRWTTPTGRRLYQEQMYVLYQRRGFILTASFTRATRKLLGEEVEELMLGFHPIPAGE